MLWQDDDPIIEENPPQICIDVAFSIDCPSLPFDHAYALSQAIQRVLLWFEDEIYAGLHLIRVAESGNGWQRPDTTTLYLSHRTKLILRIPQHRLADVQILTDQVLNIQGHTLRIIGKGMEKALLKMPVLFARHIIAEETQTEDDFLRTAIDQLGKIGVSCRKALCGKTNYIKTPTANLFTRSLMLADLSPEDSITLQQEGLGMGRKMGCGLFVPHKDIKALDDDQQKK